MFNIKIFVSIYIFLELQYILGYSSNIYFFFIFFFLFFLILDNMDVLIDYTSTYYTYKVDVTRVMSILMSYAQMNTYFHNTGYTHVALSVVLLEYIKQFSILLNHINLELIKYNYCILVNLLTKTNLILKLH